MIDQLIQELNNTHRSYILNNKTPQIFDKVKYLQKHLRLLTETMFHRKTQKKDRKAKLLVTTSN